MQEYKIVASSYYGSPIGALGELETMVNGYLQDGWEVSGNAIVEQSRYNVATRFIQTLVRTAAKSGPKALDSHPLTLVS